MSEAYTAIPADLKSRKNWVTWRMETRGDKLTKVPYCIDGTLASSTDKTTWSTFDTVSSRDKIGFCFDGDSIIGIDLDRCFDEKGAVIKKFQGIVIALKDTYREESPSGTGMHILLRATEAPYDTGRRKNFDDGSGVEVYSSGRYFTVTGKVWRDSPQTVTEYPVEAIRQLLDPLLEQQQKPSKKVASVVSVTDMDDSQIIDLCSKAKNNEKFGKLFAGDTTGYPSESESDLALAGIFSFYTSDVSQLERLMRLSGLERAKWNANASYLTATLSKALAATTIKYSDRASNDPDYIISKYDKRGQLIGKSIDYFKYSTSLKEKFSIYYFADQLYIYDEDSKIFKSHTNEIETHLRNTLQEYKINEKHSSAIRETIAHCRSMGNVGSYPFIGTFGTINLLNGSMNIEAGTFTESCPKDMYNYRIETAYKEFTDGTPELYSFLDTYGNREAIDVLAKAIWQRAYHDTVKEITIFVGEKNCGKTTVAELIQAVLDGDLHKNKNVNRSLLHELLQRFGFAGLESKLLNYGDDLPDMFIKNSGRVNTLVGSVVQHIEKKGLDGYDATVTAYYLFSCNNLPPLDDDDSAIWSKIHLVEFNNTITGDKLPREKLYTQLIKEQLLYRAIEKVREYSKVLYRNTQSEDLVRSKWYESVTDVNTFLKEATTFDPIAGTSLDEIKSHYTCWCIYNSKKRYIKYLQKKIQTFIRRLETSNVYALELKSFSRDSNTEQTIFQH